MPGKIKEYKVLEFADEHKAIAIAAKIMDFVSTPNGIQFAVDPIRSVVWCAGRRKLYVSDGAIRAASATGLTLVPSGSITWDNLPNGRSLLLGDAADWDQ